MRQACITDGVQRSMLSRRCSVDIKAGPRRRAIRPTGLEATSERLQQVMASGALDPLAKELIYIAVSTANGCRYCIHSHTAAARTKGMSEVFDDGASPPGSTT
ncbi:4-carboxymuconolactone decarboxylase domain/alkylhydroperoxidase AhpD family core domain protein [Oceanicola granulosus HTCC2516]|uniref:4-carboxymuconolactone decarboxylase domain/alkylhydroperoxidase AhpD family core domain protein n=1 Tax=Oceanicola granulosus (strain ATCC BAA-861 / DSM 15982 / KCTC 12143 / HTCC2516) TaxID=314256 RepID=Q2CB07_OCEGH|nr:carboxymuconolactone decarboxylase family protein [Oceanicola granulosus]EAR49869.1 4-carboxymuconolactone decarboxylase domain/alkylhydroperoxidase AhpD family core domain protein [Oceanicola granulosus HTCC2516]